MGSTEDHHRDTVRQLWGELDRRDFGAVAAHFADGAHYTDVAAPEEGAFGPAEIEARLRLGIGPLAAYECREGLIVAEGSVVVTEHEEKWVFDDEHSGTLPFVSVMDFGDDGLITRWWDYWDLTTLMNAAPEWWVAHIMAGYK